MNEIVLDCGHEIIEEEDEDGSITILNGFTGICPICSIKYPTDEFGRYIVSLGVTVA